MRSPLQTLTLAIVALTLPATAQQMTIDASAPSPVPQPVTAVLGSSVSPSGQTLAVNSQYLSLNGQPWIPVMGEFHFSRYPRSQWEQEILKMQAAGVQIVSTYVIWIHHEQQRGVFDFAGQRDLRAFTQLCAKHGMYVYPRIGPWAHAEVRNGGLPDWVVEAGPTRQNDPVYLAEVQSFYGQIAVQLKGLLWKDGGPVVGLQIENEYHAFGPGQGDDHIRTLKKLALAAGLDVPLYTVTGWDGAAIPLDAVLPVFGGYPDAPWDGSPLKLPPNEAYAFRFANRSAGSMGAIGANNQSAAATYRGTPFLTAEIGAGIEDTYFRRPVVTADDVAAIPTVLLGSGANLLGYYMFHGGRNPDVEPGTDITLNESQITGYPTDLPLRSYDFQAPLGEFGQQRPSLNKLKLLHYFLNDFGTLLAPMTPRAPTVVPATPADTSLPRIAARTLADRGFVFFNNHIRDVHSPTRAAFQVALKLPGGTVNLPEQPITLPAESYGIWPVNLSFGPTTLRYSTAQLFKRLQLGGQTWYFFFALPGIQPEFAFSGAPAITSSTPIDTLPSPTLLRIRPSAAATTELRLPGDIHFVVMPQAEAETLWRVTNPSLLLLSEASVFSERDQWTLDAEALNTFDFAVFGTTQAPTAESPLKPERSTPLFSHYRATVPAVSLVPTVTLIKAAGLRAASKPGPPVSWRKHPIPLAPDDSDFLQAAEYKIELPPVPPSPTLADALLTFHYTGDAARFYTGNSLTDDNFWNGIPFQLGLAELSPAWHTAASYTVRVLPLRADYNLYLEDPTRLHLRGQPQAASLEGVKITPVYRLILTAPHAADPVP